MLGPDKENDLTLSPLPPPPFFFNIDYQCCTTTATTAQLSPVWSIVRSGRSRLLDLLRLLDGLTTSSGNDDFDKWKRKKI